MSRVSSSKSQKRSATSKENIESEKRREELCRLLLSKFENKYPSIPKPVILNKINHFLDSNALTVNNLEALEDSILAAVGKCKPKADNKEETKDDDRISVMSGASDFIKRRSKSKELVRAKTRMIPTENADENSEENEWADIMKLNMRLHQEEVRQERLAKQRQKRYMMHELDRQVNEKKEISVANKQEDNAYLEYQELYLRQQNELEKKRKEERKTQMKEEKLLRDRQRKEDALRRHMEEAENKAQDRQLMEQMNKEKELERKIEMERKRIERETIRGMMEESLRLKEEQKALSKVEIEEDIKRLNRQREIAELQEKEWKENMKRKDERNRLLVETSLKSGGAKALKQETLLADTRAQEQMAQIEKKQNEEEEIRLQMLEAARKNMKDILDKQVEEKRLRKRQEMSEGMQQAEMWNKENELGRHQDAANEKKLKDANKKHQDYLLKQMEMGRRRRGVSTMTQHEYLMNKRLIAEMKTKADKLVNLTTNN
eukprot:TRINITY_DN9309_c0_g4_i2.p1 TRINITY_DN9309_c0_g4~~TRINITY_DN9309_c0_g4_i2.p1  ORF type:complete len:522 (-),score=155.60 TRINITY_DN9309_c0_g4_i2:174-1643(-)